MPSLPLVDWSVDDAKRVFHPQLVNLQNVLFCGTHGDPALNSDALEIVEMAKRLNNVTVEFYSNASVRNKDWWADLGRILSNRYKKSYYRRNDIGVFSIDGLADTNHLYRRNTNFSRIIENASAFIKAGGIARWDFLVFKHNEHQVEEAERLSKKMGFKQFRLRKTSRFAYSPDSSKDRFPVNKKDGSLDYYLEPPTTEENTNKNFKAFNSHIAKLHDSDIKEISCLNKTEFQRIYVNAEMQVHPCCFIGSDLYSKFRTKHNEVKDRFFSNYTTGFNSLRKADWERVLSHPWFKTDLVSSWQSSATPLKRCQQTCLKKFSPITSQSQSKSTN